MTRLRGVLSGSNPRIRYKHEQTSGIKLTQEEAGTLRAIDAMRNDEQHWYNEVDEGILYVHARAAITLFDDLLQRILASTWPSAFR